MRSRSSLFALVALVATFALPSAVHAAIPFFGPIIPTEYNVCPASWGLLITVINNIISFLITFAIVFLMPIMIAYGGFLYVINPVNPSKRSEANKIMLNTVLGVVIAMSGWLIVDAIMAVLYNPAAAGGTWSSLITSGGIPPCLPQAAALNQAGQTGVGAGGTVVTSGGKAKGLCNDGNPACSTSAITQAAQALNLNLKGSEAAAMSCIAMTESSGNPGTPNSNTGACGTFQITTRPGNWSNSAFHTGSCSTASSCNDANCNLQTALIMFNKMGYQPWTGLKPDGTPWNANARACVEKYDLGTSRRLQ